MLTSILATKLGMTQAWTTTGKRVAVTRCKIDELRVIKTLTSASTPQKTSEISTSNNQPPTDQFTLLVGYGRKKLANTAKPLRSQLERSGFSYGVKTVKQITVKAQAETETGPTTPQAGEVLPVADLLQVGDVVKVQGQSKGHGFSGAVKRHGFRGGPKTHGQSDRERAVGSIGAGTTPGRVFKGKRMAGRYGNHTKTISGLVVVHTDPQTGEIWLSGPVPGAAQSMVTITKLVEHREIELNKAASGISIVQPVAVENQSESGESVKSEASESAEPATSSEPSPASEGAQS